MQNHAADQLHIEVHHVPGHRLIADAESVLPLGQTARRVFHHRERFRQNLIELRPLILQRRESLRQLCFPGGGLGAQLVVGERFELLVELVDATDHRRQPLDLALIFRPENLP